MERFAERSNINSYILQGHPGHIRPVDNQTDLVSCIESSSQEIEHRGYQNISNFEASQCGFSFFCAV